MRYCWCLRRTTTTRWTTFATMTSFLHWCAMRRPSHQLAAQEAGTQDQRPIIRKTRLVRGKSINLRDVVESDAEFVLQLRLDPRRNQYLSPVDAQVEVQREWIRQYRESQGQAYFIICDADFADLGTVRIYDAIGDSFSWGSWVLKEAAPPQAAIESAVLVYTLATRFWGFRAAHFRVHPANTSVLAFHEKFGARRVTETPDEVQLCIGIAQIENSLSRFARYAPKHIGVEAD
ncbi:MAG: N-acetyltransferase [Comamonadaceae bacterium]|nr:MAG: N-acetyltransferase [Comamonadaceae bacterium]